MASLTRDLRLLCHKQHGVDKAAFDSSLFQRERERRSRLLPIGHANAISRLSRERVLPFFLNCGLVLATVRPAQLIHVCCINMRFLQRVQLDFQVGEVFLHQLLDRLHDWLVGIRVADCDGAKTGRCCAHEVVNITVIGATAVALVAVIARIDWLDDE